MKQGMRSLPRLRLRGMALLGAAFLAGVAIGVAGDRVWTTRERPAEPPLVPAMRPGFLPHMLDQLDLTPEQRSQIDQILERHRLDTDSIMRETLPRIRAATDSIRASILQVLTPEQRETLDREGPAGRFGEGMRPGSLGARRQPGLPRGPERRPPPNPSDAPGP